MPRRLFVGILLAIVAIGMAWAVYAGGPNGEPASPSPEKGTCPHMGQGGGSHAHGAGAQALLQGAKIEVKNLPNGVTVTVTSDKPEQVKAIQAHFANFGKPPAEKSGGCGMMQGGCGMMQGGGQCSHQASGSGGTGEEKPAS
jgi:hypothetical protein